MPVSHTKTKEPDTRELNTVFYEKDRCHRPGEIVQRRFKDPFHFLRNLINLAGYTPDIIRVYAGRVIPPRLREMIMLNVSVANDCHS